MDNLCHTLVGAAMGHAGLRRKTALATGTLMIAANLPDLDVLVFATDTPSIEFRRGWTHGILAQALLPIALTAIVWAVARVRSPKGGSRGKKEWAASGSSGTISVPWLLVCSYLGVYSHVFLDFLNTYGVRLLTPFEWRWFYGDAVFIMDPWLWVSLGVGVFLSRRRVSPRPAQIALTIAVLYIGGMLVSARASRTFVLEAWTAARGAAPVAAMVGPVAVTPLEKQVIIDAGPHYETGQFTWWPRPHVTFSEERVPKNEAAPAARQARDAPSVRSFLVWSRFPYYQLEQEYGGTRVSVGDMRFQANPLRDALGRGRFTATTVVPAVETDP